MKLKSKMLGFVAGASLLAMAATASAADIDFNLYGASAQFNFWKAKAVAWLQAPVASGGMGCAAIAFNYLSSDSKHAVVKGTGCAAVAGDNIVFRYSSKASFDGVFALQGMNDPSVATQQCPGTPTQRLLYNTGVGALGNGCNPATAGCLTCQDVMVGASDVSSSSFTQESHGLLKGPAGGVQTDRANLAVAPAGLIDESNLVVPFAFFANNTVTWKKCNTSAIPASKVGQLCTADADCGGVVGSCATVPVDNISREQAVMIFSGQVSDWSQFGPWYTPGTIVACLRHAGSGTAATLDYAVMTAGTTGWGAGLGTWESPPTYYFNDGSADEMNCVNTLAGAIGYADADQSLSSYGNTHIMSYQGFPALKTTVQNGAYEFWSQQHLFHKPAAGNMATMINGLVKYSSAPANNINAYWNTVSEMNVNKGGTDTNYPMHN